MGLVRSSTTFTSHEIPSLGASDILVYFHENPSKENVVDIADMPGSVIGLWHASDTFIKILVAPVFKAWNHGMPAIYRGILWSEKNRLSTLFI